MLTWLSALGVGLWLRRLFGISLGRLQQYAPRPLSISALQPPASLVGMPGISIVTPSYNQADYIEHTLRSVLDQDYPNLQHVVQDAQSDDGTADVLEGFSHKQLIINIEKDAGQADALNRGFKQTTGEIMAYLNSDDLLLPGTLNFVGAFFRDHPEVDVIYGNRLIVNEAGLEIGRWVLPYHDEELLQFIDYIPQETLFWRRSIWNNVGEQFDASLKFAMDWDLILRFSAAGARFRHVPELFGVFRAHSTQKTQADFQSRGGREMDLMRNRYRAKCPGALRKMSLHMSFLHKHKQVDATLAKQGYPYQLS